MPKNDFRYGTPTARALAETKGMPIALIAQELGKDFVTAEDVRAFINGSIKDSVANSVSATGKYWDVDHAAYGAIQTKFVDKFSKVAAEKLTAASQSIPTVTQGDNVSIQKLELFRSQVKNELREQNINLTILPFLLKALACALREFPKFNTSLSIDGEKLIYKQTIDIGVAVDTGYGLVVPVIRSASKKTIVEIAKEISSVTHLAKTKKLQQQHIGGASMTISSLGRLGGLRFTPIINPPEVAILGVSRVINEPVWQGDKFVPELRVPLDLSYDHRVINGVLGGEFLRKLGNTVANPELMIA